MLAIEAATASAKAQELFNSSHNGFMAGRYAQQIVSTPGTKADYWDASSGEAPSPLEKLSGFTPNISSANPQVFRYTFRMLTWQATTVNGKKSNATGERISKDFVSSPARQSMRTLES